MMNNFLCQTKRLQQIVEPLLLWYHQNKRDLPWRQQVSPYRVWVSEIMLQQTRVEAVKPYFERFMQELPDVRALADCPEDRLLKLWEGLGYYSRARNLQKAARVLVEQYDAKLPANFEQLRALPGIGDYTAGAIASIAFDLPVPAVDGNVLRVLTRVLCCSDNISLEATKQQFRSLLAQVEPSHGAGAFNQSLMELGAIVCLPNSPPQCLMCPLQTLCLANQKGNQTDFPVKAPKKARRIEQRTLFIFSCDIDGKSYTLLHRRPSKGVLRGLWEFPSVEGCLNCDDAFSAACSLADELGIFALKIQPAPSSRHIFTHIEWQMSAWEITAHASDFAQLSRQLPDDYRLVEIACLSHDHPTSDVALPSAFAPWREMLLSTF